MLESIVRALRNNLESVSGKPSVRIQARRVESLWKKGRREQAQALAEGIFRQHQADPRVVIFYAEFVFEKIGDRERAVEITTGGLASIGAPSLLFQLHRLCRVAGNQEFLLSFSKQYFQHPKLAGPAFLAYGSALLDTTGDFGLAVGFFNRAAVFGRLGPHSDPAELAVSPKAFSYLAELPDRTEPVTLEKPPSAPELVVSAVGDRQTLRAFSQQRRVGGADRSILFHFHVVDPQVRPKLEDVFSSDEQVFLSFERQSDATIKSELRLFELLPALLENYECPVCIATGEFSLADVAKWQARAARSEADLVVSEAKTGGLPWQAYLPHRTMFNPTADILRLSRALRTFLLQTPAAMSRRYLLPLALAECVYAAKSAAARVATMAAEAGPIVGRESLWP